MIFSSQALYMEYFFEKGMLTTIMVVLLQERAQDLKLLRLVVVRRNTICVHEQYRRMFKLCICLKKPPLFLVSKHVMF